MRTPIAFLLSYDIPRHRQDWWYLCGAACGQMIVQARTSAPVSQAAIFARAHQEDLVGSDAVVGAWESSPTGLADSINQWLKRHGSQDEYEVVRSHAPDALLRTILWRITKFDLPAVVLMNAAGGATLHWQLVVGYSATAAPASEDDLGYSVECVRVLDPAPELLADVEDYHGGALFPHLRGDVCAINPTDDLTDYCCDHLVSNLSAMKPMSCYANARVMPYAAIVPASRAVAAVPATPLAYASCVLGSDTVDHLKDRFPFNATPWVRATDYGPSARVRTTGHPDYVLLSVLAGTDVIGLLMLDSSRTKILGARTVGRERAAAMKENLTAARVGELRVASGPALAEFHAAFTRLAEAGSALSPELEWAGLSPSLSPFYPSRRVVLAGEPRPFLIRIDGAVYRG